MGWNNSTVFSWSIYYNSTKNNNVHAHYSHFRVARASSIKYTDHFYSICNLKYAWVRQAILDTDLGPRTVLTLDASSHRWVFRNGSSTSFNVWRGAPESLGWGIRAWSIDLSEIIGLFVCKLEFFLEASQSSLQYLPRTMPSSYFQVVEEPPTAHWGKEAPSDVPITQLGKTCVARPKRERAYLRSLCRYLCEA